MNKKENKRKMGDPASRVAIELQTMQAIPSPVQNAEISDSTSVSVHSSSNSAYDHSSNHVSGDKTKSQKNKTSTIDDYNQSDDGEKEGCRDTNNESNYRRASKKRKKRSIFGAILAGSGIFLAHRSRVNYVRKVSYDNGYKDGYKKGAEDSLTSVGIRGASAQSDSGQNTDKSAQLIATMNEIVDAYSAKPELILKIIGVTNHFFLQSHTVGMLTALLDSRRSHLGTGYDDIVCFANELYTGPFPENSTIGKVLQTRGLSLYYGTAYDADGKDDRGFLPPYSAMVKASCLAISYSVNNKCLLNKANSYSVSKLMQVDLLERILGQMDLSRLEGIWRWNLVDNSICRSNIIYEALPFFSFDGEKAKPLFSGFSYFGDCIVPMLKTSPCPIERDEFYLSACIDTKRRISSVLEKYSFYQPNNALNKLYGYNTALEESSFLGSSTLALDRLLSESEDANSSNGYSNGNDVDAEFNKLFWDKVSFYQLIRSYTITVSIEEKEGDKIIHIVCLPNTRVTGNHTGVATFQENIYSGMSSIFQSVKDPSTGRNYILGPMRSYCSSEYVSLRNDKVVDIADKRDSDTKQSYTALFLSMAGQDTKGTGFFINAQSEVAIEDGQKDVINNFLFESGYDPEFYKKWGLSYTCVHYSEESGYQDSWYRALATDTTSVSIKWHAVPFLV